MNESRDVLGERPPLRVLIAEPHRTVSQALTALVENVGEAKVTAVAQDAKEAVELASHTAPDVAIVELDLSPNCSLISALHALTPSTRIIVVGSRGADPDHLVKALAAGAVGAIHRETSIEALHRALRSSSRTAPVVAEEATGLLLNCYMEVLSEKRKRDVATIQALATAVEARDVSTGSHLARVTELATQCISVVDPHAAAVEEMTYGFMLHDVGKIGIPDAILNKPGPLDDHEWTIMRRHPELGVRIVEPVGFSEATTDIILCHHEHWDGGGYPNRLRHDEIPLGARAFALADAFDAMTSNRPYRAALDERSALEQIKLASGSIYDPDIVDVFLDSRAA